MGEEEILSLEKEISQTIEKEIETSTQIEEEDQISEKEEEIETQEETIIEEEIFKEEIISILKIKEEVITENQKGVSMILEGKGKSY